MKRTQNGRAWLLLIAIAGIAAAGAAVRGLAVEDGYHGDGPLAGSLRDNRPLAIYDADRNHLWNRLFAAFYIRPSNLPAKAGEATVPRIEGGDYIDFLAWGGTEYWSTAETAGRLNPLLDEFLNSHGAKLIDDPLKKAVLQRDLWAAYDHLADLNIRRVGSLETRQRRDGLCVKLARVIESLALSADTISKLPDTYAAAIKSGHFAEQQDFAANNNYLPTGLLTNADEWVEIDFFQPNTHEDLYDRFITLHAREYKGRSYFRIFYRFPGGRKQLEAYLAKLNAIGVDWRQAAQDGFILLKKDAPQFPDGTEFALVQFMLVLDDKLKPTPTKIVESVRHRIYRNTTGESKPETNTGLGMHVMEYTLKRRLLFDQLKQGGLEREADDASLYRVIFQRPDTPDWGSDRRKTLFQQCADCHTTPAADKVGVQSVPSIVHMGGFDAGAQPGIARPLESKDAGVRGARVARWKSNHETYRRMLEQLGK
jgi:hypothetical protein